MIKSHACQRPSVMKTGGGAKQFQTSDTFILSFIFVDFFCHMTKRKKCLAALQDSHI